MTREQAIEVLISRYNSGVIRSRTNDDEWRLATDTVIVALRGPEPDPDTGNVGKRVQGCWYCNDDVMQVVDSPNKPPINATYCGLCGRKLEVEG